MSQDGEKLVTTSEKGIQVRIFDTRTGLMIQEVRRGSEFANIYSLSLSKKADWLAVSSDTCHIQVFAVKCTEAQVIVSSNRKVSPFKKPSNQQNKIQSQPSPS